MKKKVTRKNYSFHAISSMKKLVKELKGLKPFVDDDGADFLTKNIKFIEKTIAKMGNGND